MKIRRLENERKNIVTKNIRNFNTRECIIKKRLLCALITILKRYLYNLSLSTTHNAYSY